MNLSKKRKKELIIIYHEKLNEEYVKGLEKEPIVGLMEWVDLMSSKTH